MESTALTSCVHALGLIVVLGMGQPMTIHSFVAFGVSRLRPEFSSSLNLATRLRFVDGSPTKQVVAHMSLVRRPPAM